MNNPRNTMHGKPTIKELTAHLVDAIRDWNAGTDHSTTMLLHCMEDLVVLAYEAEDEDYLRFVNYIVEEQYMLIVPLSTTRNANVQAIKRYIESYCWVRNIMLPKTVDEVINVSVEQVKEGLFFLTALYALDDLELTDYKKTIERLENRLVTIIKDGMSRKKQLEVIDHIETDPSYSTEFRTDFIIMLGKKPTAPPPGRKTTGKKPAPASKAQEQVPTTAPAPVAMTPFQKRQAEREAAAKAPPTPALTLAQITKASGSKMLSMPATTNWPLPDTPEPKKWCDGHRYLQENPKGGEPIALAEKSPECGYKDEVPVDEDVRATAQADAKAQAKAEALDLLTDPDLLGSSILLFLTHVHHNAQEAKKLFEMYVSTPKTDLEHWKSLCRGVNDIAPWLEQFTRPYDQQMLDKKPPEVTEREILLEQVANFGKSLVAMAEDFKALTEKLAKK